MESRKTVVITGSSRGLGLSAAEQCLKAGANVVISSENKADLDNALTALADFPNLTGSICDVSKIDDVKRLLELAVDRFGRADVWVNNAGISAPTGAVVDIPVYMGELVISTNVLGVYYGSVLATRQFQKQRGGRLINIVGRGEKKPVATANLYASSKAWIRNFTIAMKKENRHEGIDFCAYNPGFIITKLSTQVRAIRGYEDIAGSVQKIIPILGASADDAAKELCELALEPASIPVTRSRQRFGVLLPLLVKRLILRQAVPFDVSEIEVEIIEAET